MLEIMNMPGRRARSDADRADHPDRSDDISPPCRYRKELAGFQVCRASIQVAIVTGTDCGRCPVPETLERVDCFFLRARVTLAPKLTVEWACGATEDIVEPRGPDDCAECLGPSIFYRPIGSSDTMH
jgi:hypothetical protein